MEENRTDLEEEGAIEIPIEDVLDLHTFHPRDVPSLLKEYLAACHEARIYSVRIIHGKGKGVQKNRVRSLLEQMPLVASHKDAGHGAGGWGATLVELKRGLVFDPGTWIQVVEEGARQMDLPLAESEMTQFALHAQELMEWNRKVNLTAITDPSELAVKQFLDVLPLSALPPSGSNLLDIGSGGGFPGIPLKILRPDIRATMIDGSRKKVSFQKHVIRTLKLADAEARHVRAEELQKEAVSGGVLYDVIVSKAVTRLDRFVELAVPLLRRPGLLVAMKGRSPEAEVDAARPQIETEGLSVTVKKYRLPYLNIERSLVVLS